MKLIKLFSLFILLINFSCKMQEDKKLLFNQDFNHNSLNDSLWSYDLGDGCPNLCGWGNNELQLYSKENIAIRDGKLIISATKKDSSYYSGKIHTKDKFEFKYGTFEARAKLPKGHGLWPAIWMLGNDIDENAWPGCGEIDIMEHVGKEPNKIFASLHNASSFGNTINSKKVEIKNVQDEFHIYKMEWTEDHIRFFIDDNEIYTYAPENKDDKNWPYNKPFYLILNLAIGGNFGGPEVDNSIFPQEFIIDYIKVYSHQ
ncbi:glycosyl hydrolase family 16 [Tenacibaculum skagerrakense]|uniref:Glycosyl hydrolase family 16 n=1 Tax=Tenacibaculum skagerrakense TaxID=186571 RepID=A0A4R2NNL2_9FLAO|nr:glycoside hydrolase family 16 protein [Tenacibaculum skagerrakense]TCP23280.1 glycosyl hydrolase family 16 [Tenacibaculum skagerrakense]